MVNFEWLVVGAGFSGATFAHKLATVANAKVLVIDRRPHIGGNTFDTYDDFGILVHQYGPHIFHTKSTKVWQYLSQFTEWRSYKHRVSAMVEGESIPIPFNFYGVERLFSSQEATKLIETLTSSYGYGTTVPILSMIESSHKDIRNLAEKIYDWIFLGYNLKQWGLRPEELDRTVTGRVPVVMSYDSYYFRDQYQALPIKGYTKMFERMLDHKNITVLLNTDFNLVADEFTTRHIFYTGPLDELFDYCFGPLPYRSLRFQNETQKGYLLLPTGTVNFPSLQDGPATRATEYKHLTGQDSKMTTISYEYPCAHVSGHNEPYYPVPRVENRRLYEKYLDKAHSTYPNLIIGGRLGDYRYYNMDQAVSSTLIGFDNMLKRH